MNIALDLFQKMVPEDKQEKKEAIPITVEQYTAEINEAIARVEAGEYYTHEEVERMAKHW